jgi:hypothetical protein
LALVAALLCGASSAHADRIGDLSRALTRDPSWRVRLQAAVVLGKLGDRRAEPALVEALRDPNETVRGLSAQVLGDLGDLRARGPLESARRDRSAFVRDKVRVALAHLRPPPPVARPQPGLVHVEVGGIGAKVRHTPPELTAKLRALLTRDLAHTPGVTLDGAPMSGFVIDSAITSLTRRTDGQYLEISCEVSLVVGRLPSKAMVMMTSGGATVQTPRVGFRPGQELMMQADALEGAVNSAHENLLAFLRTQQQPTAGRNARR